MPAGNKKAYPGCKNPLKRAAEKVFKTKGMRKQFESKPKKKAKKQPLGS